RRPLRPRDAPHDLRGAAAAHSIRLGRRGPNRANGQGTHRRRARRRPPAARGRCEMSYWTDRVVLVTGAASGIGRATAVRFAQEGAFVAMLDRNTCGMQETAEIIGAQGRVRCMTADLCDEPSVVTAVAQLVEERGRLDVAVNVAGIEFQEDFLDSPRSEWDAVVQVNLRGTYLVCREAARTMIAQ